MHRLKMIFDQLIKYSCFKEIEAWEPIKIIDT